VKTPIAGSAQPTNTGAVRRRPGIAPLLCLGVLVELEPEVTVPTLSVLERLATALDVRLRVGFEAA